MLSWAQRPCRLIWCPVGWLVCGWGAQAVPHKTHIYSLYYSKSTIVNWLWDGETSLWNFYFSSLILRGLIPSENQVKIITMQAQNWIRIQMQAQNGTEATWQKQHHHTIYTNTKLSSNPYTGTKLDWGHRTKLSALNSNVGKLETNSWECHRLGWEHRKNIFKLRRFKISQISNSRGSSEGIVGIFLC